MSNSGISAYGAYIPSLRMSRKAIASAHAWSTPSLRGLGRGSRSFCSWDEDAITMAVEALRDCSKNRPTEDLARLVFASTTAPFADLQNASIVAMAAGMPSAISVQDTSGSLRAGISALINTLNTAETEKTCIVASDNRHAKPASVQEMHYGAGSVALEVNQDNDVLARFVASHSEITQFVDHYRHQDSPYDYYWEERWIRDEGYKKIVPQTVRTLLDKSGHTAESINHFCMPGYIPRLASGLAKKLGINAEAVIDNHAAEIGDTGTPQPLLMLITALEKANPGDKILVIGFGAGCDALLLEVTEAILDYRANRDPLELSRSTTEIEHYNQFLSFYGELDQDWGIRAETDNRVALSQLYRAQDQVTGFNAGVCPDCKAVQFPVLSTCVSCGSTATMSPQKLSDEPAQVATYTSDFLQYYPAPPMYWGLVQFDNGARLLMEMVGVNAETFETGSRLKMVYRVKQKDERRGLHRYFWKATPAQEF